MQQGVTSVSFFLERGEGGSHQNGGGSPARVFDLRTPTEISRTRVFDLRTPTEISRTRVFDLRTPTEISRTSVFDLRTPTEISRTRVFDLRHLAVCLGDRYVFDF